ncbi:DUF294 nucleotidyltransferase-like domain-containing protein [Wenzhouxiangella marina]|uniref:Uncharacterized protein n=1 Tax=Wenzhouxiangella marina TaxID=1579979 RepID=A0A0K0XYW0_9GAMM|nr:DUF294 nucleotidyltransferase-like domain-containing protein [Wenzhouxiangella marina]AKS42879.1 hypothetical protein WM2015_2521 [Wenzhouxiangella marina]MBB6087439.1 CBS domain-containing protein [Wenzhouxiangella marina]
MSTDALQPLLARVAPFSELSEAQRDSVARRFSHQRAEAGSDIGCFEPPGRQGLFLIEAGEVELLDTDGQTLEIRQAGELFGHAISIDGQRPDYRARARGKVEVWHLNAEALAQLNRDLPEVDRFLKASPGERLRALQGGRRERLADLDLRPPITVGPQTSLRDAAERMAEHQISSLPIVDGEALVGMLTDRDLRNRVVARGLDGSRPVAEVMTSNPTAISPERRIEDALVEMMKLGVHHLPVVDPEGGLTGVVSAGDLLRLQAPHPLRLVRDIQRSSSAEQVARLAQQGPGILARLVHHGSEVYEVGRMASMITDACTRRLIQLALEALGEAPMNWCWTAFGSQARMEQGLISDQDNGLILAEEPDAEAAAWFQDFAGRVCDGLNDCGYVYCPGGVMAKGDWRMSWEAWRRTFDGWMVEPEPKAVMQSSIFFDMRAVAGDEVLAKRLHGEVLEQASHSRLFRRFLAAESMGNRPALGLFGQFAREDGKDDARGLNLKKRGVIPIVDLARVRALEGAIRAVHTEDRIRAAAEAEIMSQSDADDLIHALRFIGNVRLRHQVALFDQGKQPNHLVDPDELSGLHRRYLRSAFGIVKTAQKALELRYSI